MAVLKRWFVYLRKNKKVKASSLTEVLVASVLILVVFGIAVVTFDSTLQSTININTQPIETELNELQYLYRHGKIKPPFKDAVGNWEINVEKKVIQNETIVFFDAIHKSTKKRITKKTKSIGDR
jgi:hypothetical protein